jgi:hypothetical protein
VSESRIDPGKASLGILKEYALREIVQYRVQQRFFVLDLPLELMLCLHQPASCEKSESNQADSRQCSKKMRPIFDCYENEL